MCVRLVATMLMLVATMAFPVLANDAVSARAYFRDDTGQRSLAEVQTQTFTPYTGLLNQGFQRNVAYWIKLRIDAANPTEPPYVLRLRPNWHDDIRLYDPADPSAALRKTGDQTAWSESEFPSLSHGFLLKKTDYEREVFLRVQSVHTYLFDARALEQSEAASHDWKILAIYFAYLCLVSVVFLWAAINFILRPEPVIATFSLYQFSTIFYCALPFGLARIGLDGLLSAVWLDFFTTMTLLLNSFAGMVFHRSLLAQYAPSRWFLWPLNVLLAMPAVGIAMLPLAETTWALKLNAISIFAFGFAILATAWFGLRSANSNVFYLLPRWSMRFFYTLFFVLILLGVTPVLGLVHAETTALNFFLVHSATSTVIMGSFLFYRARKITDQQIEQLALTRQKAELESLARLQQNSFMSMLNHEIKTPLAVLKLLVAEHPRRELAEENIDTIVKLLERCLLSDRLDTVAAKQSIDYSPAQVVEAAILETGKASRFQVDELTTETVDGDPELFAVCVANLLDNALKYGQPDTRINVTLNQGLNDNAPQLCLAVCNRIGRSGVPDLGQVFDKYYRAESARSLPGTGLGLYLVKSFADMMGGRVACQIDHSHTKTICFTLTLPR